MTEKHSPAAAVTLDNLDWVKTSGQIPVVVQDPESLRVLMVGVMNAEALAKTQSSGLVTFWSRSKGRLWQKGETSGNALRVISITPDCDGDCLLIMARPSGNICHTGKRTCFDNGQMPVLSSLATLADLQSVIRNRHKDYKKDDCNRKDGHATDIEASYTAKLFAAGIKRIAQKVGEEGVEVALAAVSGSDNLAEEAADLLYHLLVALEASGLTLEDVLCVLRSRAR